MADKQALYYISLACDVSVHNTDDENEQWQKANQNRLNQNFSILSAYIAALEERIESLENQMK